MAVRLNDEETAMLVLARGLITTERLAPFRAPGAGQPGTLFERLVAAGVIMPQLLGELEHGGTAPAAPPQRATTPGGGSGLPRRLTRIHAFEDAPARPPSSQTLAAVPHPPHAPPRPPSPAAIPVVAASLPSAHRAATTGGVPLRPAPPPPAEVEAAPAAPRGWPGGLAPADQSPGHIQQYLLCARQLGASDLHINAGGAPTLFLHGDVRPLEGVPALTAAQAATLVRQVLTHEQWDYLDRVGELCCAYAFAGGGRYRATAFRHRGGCDIACRVIPEQVPPWAQLGLPEGSARLAQYTDGLVLIASPACSGKTTTLMALVDQLAHARHAHIVTLEEPIEYLLQPASSRITQREAGSHVAGYAAALQGLLREDAEVLVIGELRDEEATAVALRLAEAGHLVLATVQALDCARAIDRILECSSHPAHRHNLAADNLRAVFAQQLVRRADGQGRVPACELLINSISVGNIIREGKTQNLVNIMQTGRQQGMIMADDSLKALVDAKLVSGEEAYHHAKNKAVFKQYLPKPQPATAPEPPKDREGEPAKPPAARR